MNFERYSLKLTFLPQEAGYHGVTNIMISSECMQEKRAYI